MNKADKIFIVLVVIATGLLYALLTLVKDDSGQRVAVVEYKNKEVLTIDMEKDGTYQVEATKGIVYIEVKNNQIRVEKETSPYHYCSLQGWVERSNVPIVCLPNDLVIVIKGKDSGSGEDVNLH